MPAGNFAPSPAMPSSLLAHPVPGPARLSPAASDTLRLSTAPAPPKQPAAVAAAKPSVPPQPPLSAASKHLLLQQPSAAGSMPSKGGPVIPPAPGQGPAVPAYPGSRSALPSPTPDAAAAQHGAAPRRQQMQLPPRAPHPFAASRTRLASPEAVAPAPARGTPPPLPPATVAAPPRAQAAAAAATEDSRAAGSNDGRAWSAMSRTLPQAAEDRTTDNNNSCMGPPVAAAAAAPSLRGAQVDALRAPAATATAPLLPMPATAAAPLQLNAATAAASPQLSAAAAVSRGAVEPAPAAARPVAAATPERGVIPGPAPLTTAMLPPPPPAGGSSNHMVLNCLAADFMDHIQALEMVSHHGSRNRHGSGGGGAPHVGMCVFVCKSDSCPYQFHLPPLPLPVSPATPTTTSASVTCHPYHYNCDLSSALSHTHASACWHFQMLLDAGAMADRVLDLR